MRMRDEHHATPSDNNILIACKPSKSAGVNRAQTRHAMPAMTLAAQYK